MANGHTAVGVIMAVRHATLPLHGVQFHPESVLTEGGHRILANWLALCGHADAVERSAGLSPLVHDAEGVARPWSRPAERPVRLADARLGGPVRLHVHGRPSRQGAVVVGEVPVGRGIVGCRWAAGRRGGRRGRRASGSAGPDCATVRVICVP